MSNQDSGRTVRPWVFVAGALVLIALVAVIIIVALSGGTASPAVVSTPEPTPVATPEPTPVPVEVVEASPPADEGWTVARLEEVIKANTPLRFRKDTSRLLPGEMAKVEAMAEALRHFKDIHLRFEGHTAEFAKPAWRFALSAARAERVRWALEYRVGYDITSITVKGYGSTRLISRGTSEAAMAPNRRVEIILQHAVPK